MAELKFKNKKKAAQSSGPVSPADMVYAKLMVRLYTSDRLAFYYKLRALLKFSPPSLFGSGVKVVVLNLVWR